jgi:hypothetical protein
MRLQIGKRAAWILLALAASAVFPLFAHADHCSYVNPNDYSCHYSQSYYYAQGSYYSQGAYYSPATCSVSLTPNPKDYAASATLSWSSSSAHYWVYINNVGYVGSSGSISVSPTASTDYSCYAYGYGGSDGWHSYSLTVNAPASCSLPWGGTLAHGGSATAYQAATVSYGSSCSSETRTCSNGSLSGSYQYQYCAVDNPPPTCSVSVSPTSMVQGQSSTLSWSSSNATSCIGTNFSTGGATSGSVSVSPSAPTTYTAACTASGTGSETFNSNGTFTVPVYETLTVKVWGGGGGGGSSWGGASGGAGGASSFNASVVANGGAGGVSASGSNGYGGGGAGGSASGGTTNTTGTAGAGGAAGGSGGTAPGGGGAGGAGGDNGVGSPGSVPGGGGGGGDNGATSLRGGGGGSGGYAMRTYASGQFTPGSGIAVVVGAGGTAGNDCSGPEAAHCYDMRSGNAGAKGRVEVTWTTGSTVQCTGTGDDGLGAELDVSCTESWSCTGGSGNVITHTNADCSTDTVTTCEAPEFCSAGSATCLYNAITGNITASPRLVASGKTTTVAWNTSDAETCTVTGTNGDTWTGTNTSRTSSAITEVVHYTLICDDADPDTTEDDFTDRVTVVRVPAWLEF